MAVGDVIPLDLDALGGPGGSPVLPTPARPVTPLNIDRVIAEEGAGHIAPIVKSVYQQESGSGRNTRTSVDGARGGFQIIPDTFKRFAQPNENIDNPEDNARVGVRYLRFLAGKANNDPAKIFTGYFSGEGNIGDRMPWRRDAADGNGTRVSQYVAQNMRRLSGAAGPVPTVGSGAITDAPDDLGISASFSSTPDVTPEISAVRAAGRGLAHGVIGLMGGVATGADWLAGAMGAHDFKNLMRNIAADFSRSAEQYAAPSELQGNILDNPSLMKKGAWWAYHLADTAPSLAASVIPGLGASRMITVAGEAMKLTPATIAGLARVGSSAVAGSIGGGLEGTQTYNEVLKRGGSEEEARAAATMMALASGTLNALSFGKITGRGKSALRRFVGGFVTEGATEWAEEPVEGAILSSTSVARPEDDPLSRAYQGFNVFPIAGVMGGGAAVMAGGAKAQPERQPIPQNEPHDLMQEPVVQPTQSGPTQPGLPPWQRVREQISGLPVAQRVPAGPVDITRVRAAADAAQAPTLTAAPEDLNFRLTPPGPVDQSGVNFELTSPEAPNLNQLELDLNVPEAGAPENQGQLHLPVFDTPLQYKVKQGGKPNRSDLIQTLNAVATRPVFTKGGDPKRKWLASVMQAADPLSAIRTAYENGTHPQAELLDKWHAQLSGTSIEQYSKNGDAYDPPKVKVAPAKRGRKPPAVEAVPVSAVKPKRTVKTREDIRRVAPDEKQRAIEDLETAYMQDVISQDDFEDLSKAIDDGEAGALQQARKVLDYALQTRAQKEKAVAPTKSALNTLDERMKGLRTSTKSAGRLRKRAAYDPSEPGYDATGASVNLPTIEKDQATPPQRVRTDLTREALVAAHSGDLQGVLRDIAKSSNNPLNRRLARVLQGNNTRGVPLTVVVPGRSYVEQVPQQITNNKSFGTAVTTLATGQARIFINASNEVNGLTEETILHEAIHAALIAKMAKLGRAADHMSALWQLYHRYLETNYGGKSVPGYVGVPFYDFDEFITYSMTSPEFQQFLREAQIERTSLWDRFVAIVSRILGFEGNKTYLSHVLDAGFAMLEEAQSLDRGEVQPFGHVRIEKNLQAVPQQLEQFVEKNMVAELPANTRQTLESMGHAARTKWLGAVTLRQLADLYKRALPSLEKYVSGVHRMDATVNRISTAASEVAARWGSLKDADALADVMGLATTQKIHPDVPLAEQTWLKDDPRAADNYNRLREKYNALSPDAKKVYQEAKRMLQDHWTQVRELLKAEIAKTFTDPVQRDGNLARIEHEFGRVQGPYFPLSRFGKYILTAKVPGKEDSYTVEFFENIFERDAEVRDLQRQGYEVKTAIASEFNPVTDGVPSAFIRGLYQAIDNIPNVQAELSGDLKDAVTQLYWRSLPEVAGAKRFLRRRTVKGWNKDMRRSFANAMFHGAFYRAKLEYAPELRRTLLEMDEQKRSAQGQTGSRDMADAVTNEINRRHDLAMRRTDTPFVDMLSRVGYVYYLGLTPSFALINTMQNPLVAYPMLAARYGWVRSFTAMMRAAKEFVGARFTPDKDGRWTAELDLNRVTRNPDERAALQEWLDEGLVDLTQAHDLSAMASGTSTTGRTILKVASFLPHHTEVFNRVTSGLAAYRLARGAGQAHQAATQYGKEIIAGAHFDYSASNKPYYMSPGFSKAAKLVFMFKQYQQHMIYALARNLHQSFKGASSEERAVARRTLFGLITMTGLAAGAMGLPFFGTAMLLAQLIYAMGGDDDDPKDPEVEFRQFLADAFGVKGGELIARGALRKTGLELSERVGQGNLLFRFTGKDAVGKEAFNQLIVDMLGPVAAIGANAMNSVQYFERGDFQRGWETLTPKVVKDLLKAERYASEGLSTARGVRRMKSEDFTTYDIVAQAMGFTPQKVAEHYAAEGAVQGKKAALDNRRQLLISVAALARAHNDAETFREALEKIQRFSQTNPRQGITADSINRAVQQIKQAEALANSQGVYVKPKDRNLLLYGAFADVGE